MAKSFKLILESGPNAGSSFPLEKDEMTLGRDVNNDVVINDPEVSRKHARLVRQGDSYFFEDLGSTNGTFILGERLSKPVLLVPNSKITIGERVQLSFVVEGFDPSETIVAPRRMEMPVQTPPTPAMPPVMPPSAQRESVPPPPAPVRPVAAPVVNPPYAPVPPAPNIYAQPPAKKKSKAWLVILIIVAVLLVFCVVPFIIIDATDNWCNLFPGIFQMMGACF